MSNVSKVLLIEPQYAIPGGEITVFFETPVAEPSEIECLFDGIPGEISAASTQRLMVRVPEGIESEEVDVKISAKGKEGESHKLSVGGRLCGKMHIVANPAVDPKDGSIVMTRSGSRGQELPATLFRYRNDVVEEMSVSIMNPTGVAFDSNGQLFVTNRADGVVVQINNDRESVPLATGLGVATGIAFDPAGKMHVGDRGGTIYRVSGFEGTFEWARLDPSVSAFHMAFGPDGSLFVSAPGLCSHDVIHRIAEDGSTDIFYKGLGRPQGLAFDREGRLYAAACTKGRHGIVRISPDGNEAEFWLSGMNVIGLCFDADGRAIVATSDSLYRVDVGIFGTLLGD